jgi:hypothetical protein
VALLRGGEEAVTAKPTVEGLGIDLAAQTWQRSGEGDGAIEIAFVQVAGDDWILMRVAGDADQRVLVFDRNEWECFLDGARNGEFDDAAFAQPASGSAPGSAS